MAFEQLTNNAASTTTGAVSGVTNPVAVTVANASAFPAAPNFRIVIDSEVLLVTAVAGAVFTCQRAQEGTAIAAHASGAAVTHVLTAGSFRQLLADMSVYDLAANRPAAGVAGRMFYPSDGGPVFRDTGAAWQCWVDGMGPFTPPLATFQTWVNQSSATLTTAGGIPSIQWLGLPTGGENLNMRVDSVAGMSTWKLTAALRCVHPPGSAGNFGLVARSTTSSRIWGHSYSEAGGTINGYQWSNATTFSGNNTHNDNMNVFGAGLMLLRLRYDGTNLYFEHSYDFCNWTVNRAYTLSTSYVPDIDQVGFYINASNTRAGQAFGMTVYHAKLEA